MEAYPIACFLRNFFLSTLQTDKIFPLSSYFTLPVHKPVDDLLNGLEWLGVGCHWRTLFVGAVYYADDLALLAPTPSALRLMLHLCEEFALSHGLRFNPTKTQLIRFGRMKSSLCSDHFELCGARLTFSDSVTHLGHKLTYDLSDSCDILHCTQDLIKKANCMLYTFSAADAPTKTRLLQSYCLSLYGSALWNLDCRELRSLEVAFNKILRRIWHLPARCHTAIVHSVAGLQSIFNIVRSQSIVLFRAAKACPSNTVRHVFNKSKKLVFTSTGFNAIFGDRFFKVYNTSNKKIL